MASRLVDLVGRTYVINGHTINIGASVGVAIGADAVQARDLLRNGDLALYEAKKAGKARYRMFDSGMDALLLERHEMEIDLRRALALKQFKLNYQPFLNVISNRVDGFEALLRWEHPVKGNIPLALELHIFYVSIVDGAHNELPTYFDNLDVPHHRFSYSHAHAHLR